MAKDFAEALETQLEKAGISGYRLSQLTGLSKQLIHQLQHRQAQPGWDTVAKIAKALGVSCEVFVPDGLELPTAPDARGPGRPPGDRGTAAASGGQPRAKRKRS